MLEQDLNRLSIYELRRLARSAGVKAPTMKTQNTLIEEILLIEKGDLKPVKSRMGRPPKKNNLNFENINNILQNTSLATTGYEPIKREISYNFASNAIKGLDCDVTSVMGVVRQHDDIVYIKDYLGNIEYGVIKQVPCKVKTGDIIVGNALNTSGEFKKIDSFKLFSFNNDVKVKNGGKLFVVEKENVNEMYETIKNSNENKVIVEVETSKSRIGINSESTLFFYTNECEDVIKTYNMLLDVKNSVKKLCENNQNFSLNLIDAEYIYSILTVYYDLKKQPTDVNAGQYFKEIFSFIANSENASATIYQKKNGMRNSYLDMIINKYCIKNN